MNRRTYRILTEASGSLTAGYLIKGIREAGHVCVASDIDPRCFGGALGTEALEVVRIVIDVGHGRRDRTVPGLLLDQSMHLLPDLPVGLYER